MTSSTLVPAKKQELTSTIQQHRKPLVAPATDIFESDSALTMIMSVPGVSHDDVQITLQQHKLTVSAEPKFPVPEGVRLNYAEFVPCIYERSFSLPDGLNTDAIEATVANGTLKLVMPKAESARLRKIPVKCE
jgi:HSP20 family molecular chaperone IbpA